MDLKFKLSVTVVVLVFTPCVFAEDAVTMSEVEVKAEKLLPLPASDTSGLDRNSLERKRTNTATRQNCLMGSQV